MKVDDTYPDQPISKQFCDDNFTFVKKVNDYGKALEYYKCENCKSDNIRHLKGAVEMSGWDQVKVCYDCNHLTVRYSADRMSGNWNEDVYYYTNK